MCSKTLEFSCHKVLSDNTACASVDNHHVVHLIAVITLHLAHLNLAVEARICAEQQLLSCLSLCIECAAHLSATERTVCQQTTIFTSKRNTLCHALVDNIVRYLCKTIDVGFASAIVTTLHGVVEQSINRVAVVLVILGCIDTALCSDRVCTAWRILDAEVKHVKAHFT